MNPSEIGPRILLCLIEWCVSLTGEWLYYLPHLCGLHCEPHPALLNWWLPELLRYIPRHGVCHMVALHRRGSIPSLSDHPHCEPHPALLNRWLPEQWYKHTRIINWPLLKSCFYRGILWEINKEKVFKKTMIWSPIVMIVINLISDNKFSLT